MSHLRTRLLALTCTAAAVLSPVGLAAAAAAPSARSLTTPSLTSLRATHPGLDRLLADGTPNGRAIVELDAAPSDSQVASLESLGLTVQPLHRLPMALVEGSVAQIAAAVHPRHRAPTSTPTRSSTTPTRPRRTRCPPRSVRPRSCAPTA